MKYEGMTKEQLIKALIELESCHKSLAQSVKTTTAELQKANQRLALAVIEHKQAQEKSAHFHRLYSVLSKVNEAIVCFREPGILYQQVCRIIVEFGLFQMAWIGLVDPVTLLVEPVGHWGVDKEYLDKITVSVEEIPEGFGPIGTAIRQGRYDMCPDFQHDPRMYPWRTEAIKRGYRSCIALPLKVGGKNVGVLHVYATEPYFFKEEDIALLVSLADNISFAVEFTEQEIRRKQVQEQLRKSKEQYQQLIELSPNIITVQTKGKIVFINRTGAKILGATSPEEIIGKPVMSIIHPDYRAIVKEKTRQKYNENRTPLYELKLVRLDGVIIDVDATAVPLDFEGYPAILAIARDITERKQAEKALQLSKERFSKAFNASPIPMSIYTLQDERFISVNDSFVQVTGYRREEVIGRKITGLNLFAHRKDLNKIRKLISKQEPYSNLEVKLRSKSGDIRTGLLSTEIIEVNGEQCILALFNDITERKQMEKEMERVERLNLIGEMATGIGHEIRNPMTTVRGFLQVLKTKRECSKYQEHFNLMIKELDKANSIITQFISLARNRALNKKTQNLNAIVDALFPLIKANIFRAGMHINWKPGNIADLSLDEKEIRQLVLNLVRNGMEAMSPGGTITISTFMADSKVVLSVQDEGKGIDPATLEKMGTPFFTTKDNGTGLGLAVCHSIAARHNAKIDIDTGPSGTTVYVRFKLQVTPGENN